MLEEARDHASSTDHIARVITRVDTNVADGLSKAIKELGINKVVLGWHENGCFQGFFVWIPFKQFVGENGQNRLCNPHQIASESD